jgi:hypothetical protein
MVLYEPSASSCVHTAGYRSLIHASTFSCLSMLAVHWNQLPNLFFISLLFLSFYTTSAVQTRGLTCRNPA